MNSYKISNIKELQLKIETHDTVFKPSEMTKFLLTNLHLFSELDKSAKILDLGTGSGIIGIALAKLGYTNVFISDISQNSIECALLNFDRNNVKRPKEYYQSNLFEDIKSEEKFDLIIVNPPSFPSNRSLALKNDFDYSIFSGLDGSDLITKFVQNSTNNLTDTGGILFTYPSFLNQYKIVEAIKNQKFSAYTSTKSSKVILSSYKYEKEEFVKNFKRVFSNEDYMVPSVKDQSELSADFINEKPHSFWTDHGPYISFNIYCFYAKK